MSEWWTYTVSDFLLFSPRTYYRMIERYNAAVWPWHVVALGLGVAILVLLRRPTPRQGRIVSDILALAWAWVTWAFIWSRYTTINWAASYFAVGFAIEVVLLAWLGVRGGIAFRMSPGARGVIGLTLFLVSLALYPFLGLLAGRGAHRAELFGVTPDPTVIATLGLLLLAEPAPRWWLFVVPLLWCVVGGALLWAMGSMEAYLLAAALAGALLLRRRRLASP